MMDESPLWDAVADTQAVAPARGIPGTLHGAEDIANPDVIWWAPDMMALAALREAGYPQTVALVPARGRGPFDALQDRADWLARAGKIVIAGGAAEWAEELSRRLGRQRVWRVTWPDGVEDAADLLQRQGSDALRAAVEAAEPYPIEGIYHPTSEAMLAYRHAPAPKTLTTGCEASDKVFRIPGEGKLIVVTGIPNHGKSTYLTHLMAHVALTHDRRFAVYSPEMGDWKVLCSQITAWRAGKPFRPQKQTAGMTDQEIAEFAEWARTRFAFLACDAHDSSPTLDWLLGLASACVLRDGTTDLVIDPWNELDHDDGGQNETKYTGRALQRLRTFATRHGCNVWIVAHPRIIRPFKPGEPVPVPTAYDISGSSNWNNKGDLILAVHCPDTVTQIHVLKARFSRWGRRGGVAHLEFDQTSGRFRSANLEDAPADPVPGDIPPPADPSEYGTES